MNFGINFVFGLHIPVISVKYTQVTQNISRKNEVNFGIRNIMFLSSGYLGIQRSGYDTNFHPNFIMIFNSIFLYDQQTRSDNQPIRDRDLFLKLKFKSVNFK